jgi:hypothetical protein
MNAQPSRMERRIRVSGILMLSGIAVEVATLIKIHPLTFMAFTTVGLLFFAAGIVVFLLSLLEVGPNG